MLSFSLIANSRAMREVCLAVYSIRRIHDDPIFLICSDEVKEFLQSHNFKDLHFRTEANPEDLEKAERKLESVKAQNSFHNKGMIWKKMDCIEWAVHEAGQTFFIDADVVLCAPVCDVDERNEVNVSPHYHVKKRRDHNRIYGSINAGYFWTRSSELAEKWREIYLTRSNFYEQEGMIHFFEDFDVGLFDQSHNVGFWRFDKYWQKGELMIDDSGFIWNGVKSLHFHRFPETYAHADKGLKQGYQKLCELMETKMPEDLRRFANAL